MPNNLSKLRLLLYVLLPFAFFVILVGAYTRLTDAGLGCPDWPGCYGHWFLGKGSLGMDDFIKAWTEMFHRYIAGFLGLGILFLSIFSKQKLVAKSLLILVIFQALLGMWTVTEKLRPIIVMGHLLGGMGIISLLWLLFLENVYKKEINSGGFKPRLSASLALSLRPLAALSLGILILQIILGGWTSANYAALVCPNWYYCDNLVFNVDNLLMALNPLAGIPVDPALAMPYPGKVILNMMHKINAFLTAAVIVWLCVKLFKKTDNKTLRRTALVLSGLLMLQIYLGFQNVLKLLPLWAAVAHNGVAVLLLLALITINYHLSSKPSH
ncbi:MAG: COX15/CtaA family protein [Gammaproteobacteria bacterium]